MTIHQNDPIDLSMLSGMLSFIPSDLPRDDWARLLMAAKSEFGEAAKGAMFDWSATAENFDRKAFSSTWKSIRSGGGVTIASLVHEAKENGYKFAPLSASDKQRFRSDQRKRAAQRKQSEAIEQQNREQGYKAAKVRANELINVKGFYANPEHPYFVKKGINKEVVLLNTVHQLGSSLMIPAYQFNQQGYFEISTLQYIGDKGGKYFLKGGQTKGSFFPIRFDGHILTIVICEGFATGVSLAMHYEPTAEVICVFNARNLKPVARAFKVRYPMARIIIAGDNDRATELKTGVNVGIVKANEAAKAVDGAVFIPEFLEGEAGTDWNDRFVLDQRALSNVGYAAGGAV